jgi:hypothetical protein
LAVKVIVDLCVVPIGVGVHLAQSNRFQPLPQRPAAYLKLIPAISD